MRLLEFLTPSLIWPSLKARNKSDVIEEIAAAISDSIASLKTEEIKTALLNREKLGSTGIENGIAIPHAKLPSLQRSILAFAKSDEGIDFKAHDGRPTHIFFVLLAPDNRTSTHLKILAKLSKVLKNEAFRKRLLETNESQEILDAISEEEKEE